MVAITASEARRALFPLIEKVNDDRSAIEITSKDVYKRQALAGHGSHA